MEFFPAISISDFQLPIFRSRRAIYTSSIPCGLFRMHPMFPLPCMDSDKRPIGTLDLSMSILRSVSPVHLEYMRNMGTMSSMSVSIICEGKLWGLISGHHRGPRTVPYLVRSACDLLTRLVATQLMGLATSASLHQMVHFHAVQRRMLTQMAGENNYLAAMADQMEDLIQITDAEGVALVMDGQFMVFGDHPVRPRSKKAGGMDGQQAGTRSIREPASRQPDRLGVGVQRSRQWSAGHSNLSRPSKLSHVVSAGGSTNGTVGWANQERSRTRIKSSIPENHLKSGVNLSVAEASPGPKLRSNRPPSFAGRS